MGFLCQKLRKALSLNHKKAMSSWHETVFRARLCVSDENWENAILIYGSAFEISEILLSQKPDNSAVNRYMRTALEFAYSLRYSPSRCDLNALTDIVEERLSIEILSQPIEKWLTPLQDVIHSPLHQVEHWMQMLFSLDTPKPRSSLH